MAKCIKFEGIYAHIFMFAKGKEGEDCYTATDREAVLCIGLPGASLKKEQKMEKNHKHTMTKQTLL